MSDVESVLCVENGADKSTNKEEDEDDWKKMENIRVICRFRPINSREITEEKNNGLVDHPPELEHGKVIKLVRGGIHVDAKPMEFIMDDVFAKNISQNEVFLRVGKPMVLACLEGYNSTIVAYGQTGSGKTFTMFGPEKSNNPQLLGIVQRSVSFMFEDLKRRKESKEVKEYQVLVEFIQLYREQINDLLEPDTQVPLKIRLDIATDSPYIPNLRQVDCSNTADVVRLLNIAQNNRVVDKTLMNAVSSRSHMVMTIRVIQTMKDGVVKKSKLNFADLAGSESYEKALGGTTGSADPKKIAELKTINLSLTNLTTAINYLSKGRKASYRSSQLTFLLMDSLGGNSKTTLIVACSPHIFNRNETIRTLRFAKTAKAVKNKAKMNKEYSKAQLMAMVRKLQRENKKLKAQIALLETCLTTHGIDIPTLDDPKSAKKSKHRQSKTPDSEDAGGSNRRPPLLQSKSAYALGLSAKVNDVSGTVGHVSMVNNYSSPNLVIPENNDEITIESQTHTQSQSQSQSQARKQSLDLETGLDMFEMQSQKNKKLMKKRHSELTVGGSSSSTISIDSTASIKSAEFDKMMEELKELQDELSRQENEVSQLREELEAKSEEIDTLTDELQQSKLIAEDIDTLKKNKEYLDNQLENISQKLHEKEELFESEKLKFENIVSELNDDLKEKTSIIDELTDEINDLQLFNSQLTDENNALNLAMSNQKHEHESQLNETIKDKNKMESVATKAGELLSKFFMIQIQNDKVAHKQLKKTETDLTKLETDMKKTIDDYYEAVDSQRRKSSVGNQTGKNRHSKDKDKLSLRPRTARPGTARKKPQGFGNFGIGHNSNNSKDNIAFGFDINRIGNGSIAEDATDSLDGGAAAGADGGLRGSFSHNSNSGVTLMSPQSQVITPRVLQTNLVYEMQTMTKCLNTAIKKLNEQRENHANEMTQVIDKKDKAIDKLKSKNVELINKYDEMENNNKLKLNDMEQELLELRETINNLENDLENVEKENKDLKKKRNRAFVLDSTVDSDGNTYLFESSVGGGGGGGSGNSSENENSDLLNQLKYLEDLNKSGFVDEHQSAYQAAERMLSPHNGQTKHGPSQMAPWRKDLDVGSKVDCMDDACLWWTSQVIECDNENDKLKIRYDGFDARWDDWVTRNSQRLAPYKSRATGGRETKGVNVKIEIVAERNGKAVFKQGWLSKQGGTFKTYKTRYFVLYGDGTMHYFKQMTDSKPLGGFNIKDMTETRRFKIPSKNLVGFEIVTPKRDWRFQCDSERSVTDWISVIHAVSSGKLDTQNTNDDETVNENGKKGSLGLAQIMSRIVYKGFDLGSSTNDNAKNMPHGSGGTGTAGGAGGGHATPSPHGNGAAVGPNGATIGGGNGNSIQLDRSSHPPISRAAFDSNFGKDRTNSTMRIDSYQDDLSIESLPGSDNDDAKDGKKKSKGSKNENKDKKGKKDKNENGKKKSKKSSSASAHSSKSKHSDTDAHMNAIHSNKDISSAIGSDLQGINEDNSMFGGSSIMIEKTVTIDEFGDSDMDSGKNSKNNKKKKNKDEDPKNIDYQGWMYKQGKWKANWTLRYCKLIRKPTKLRCYTDRDGKLTHEVDLSQVLSLTDIKQTKNNIERLAEMEIPTIYAFQMVTPTRTYTFACKSEIELNLWMKHTKQLIQTHAKQRHKQSMKKYKTSNDLNLNGHLVDRSGKNVLSDNDEPDNNNMGIDSTNKTSDNATNDSNNNKNNNNSGKDSNVDDDDEKMNDANNKMPQRRLTHSKPSGLASFGSLMHKAGKNFGRMIGVTPEYAPVTEVMRKENILVETRPAHNNMNSNSNSDNDEPNKVYFGTRNDRTQTALVVGSRPMSKRNYAKNKSSIDDSNIMTTSGNKVGNGNNNNNNNNNNNMPAMFGAVPSNSLTRAKLKELRRKSVPVLLAGKNFEVFLLANGQKLTQLKEKNDDDNNDNNNENDGKENENNNAHTSKKGKNRRCSAPQTKIETDFANLHKTLKELNQEYKRSKSRSPESDMNNVNNKHHSRKHNHNHNNKRQSRKSSKASKSPLSPKDMVSPRSHKQERRFSKSKSPSGHSGRRSRTGSRANKNEINNNNNNDRHGARVRARTRSKSRTKKYDQNGNLLGSPLDSAMFPGISEEDSKVMDEYAKAMSQTKIPPLNTGANNKPDVSLSPPAGNEQKTPSVSDDGSIVSGMSDE